MFKLMILKYWSMYQIHFIIFREGLSMYFFTSEMHAIVNKMDIWMLDITMPNQHIGFQLFR
ncbi:hypothetical protein GCM10009112_12390 [Marinomonas arenicola]